MTAEGALATLTYSSLRYSAPSRFNDPFDHRVSFTFPYSERDFSAALLGEILRVVYDDSVVLKNPTSLGQLALRLRGVRDKAPRDELINHLIPGAAGSAARFKKNEDALNAELTAFLGNARVLCVTEEVDNVVMWSHYGDKHRGIALRLQCIDEADNTLLAARPVKYADSFPPFPPLTDYVRHLTGEIPLGLEETLYKEAIYLKHKDWAYEREWRVHVPLFDGESAADFSDWPESPLVFGAIYLGCRISISDAQRLMRVVEEKLPHIEIYESKMSRSRLGMEFERLR